MGLDVALLPVVSERSDGEFICLRRLDLDLNRTVSVVSALTGTPVPGRVRCPTERGRPVDEQRASTSDQVSNLAEVAHDAHGGALHYLTAGELAAAFDAEADSLEEISSSDQDAIDTIAGLDPTTKVVLYWW